MKQLPQLHTLEGDKKKLTHKEALEGLISLHQMLYPSKRRFRRGGESLRYEKLIMQNDRSCFFCPETRALHKAHIIPLALYQDAQIVEKHLLPEELRHSLYMCPTHHHCYDKFLLNDVEKAKIVYFLHSNQYTIVFSVLLDSLEVIAPGTDKCKKRCTSITELAWQWWRSYCYGN